MKGLKKNLTSFYFYLILTLSFILAVLIIAIIMKNTFTKKNAAKLVQLEQIIYDMRSSIHEDSMQQYQIQKIIAIIEQYNLTLPHEQKYKIAEEIYRMNKKFSNLNTELICATITFETNGTWNPEMKSSAGAMGLMQIMPTTGMFIASYEDISWTAPEDILYNPIYNIRIGSRYLASLIEMYDIDGGLAAYKGGERLASLWIGNGKESGILPPETQTFVPSVQKLYEEFQEFRL
jgi:soluble lytic murein transglycosylase